MKTPELFKCKYCGSTAERINPRKIFCSKYCAWRQDRKAHPYIRRGRQVATLTRIGDYEINVARFWANVGPDGIWAGQISHFGYGAFSCKYKGKFVSRGAHRIAWMLKHGAIPEGLSVLHRNDTPPCVDVSQLFLGTQADNVADCKSKGRSKSHKLKGEQIGSSKLKSSDVSEIRRLLESGTPPTKVAADFQIDRGHLWRIRTRRAWAHV